MNSGSPFGASPVFHRLRRRPGAGLDLLLAAVAALSAAGGARAEDRAGDEGAPPRFGETLEVEAPRRRAPADPTAASTVVEAGRFAGEAKTVAEMVSTAPGVAVNQYGGLGQLATVSIRGSSADQVPVFLDGLPLQTAAGGGVDLSRIPAAWIERIEVVRGAVGSRFGPGAMAGAVNVVTRPAAAGAWSASATAGSFGTRAAAADGAAGGERLAVLAAGAFDATAGDFTYLDPLHGEVVRRHAAATSGGGLAKLRAALGPGRLDAVLLASGGARDLPGTLGHATPGDGQRDWRAGLVARWEQPVSEGLFFALDLEGREDALDVAIAPFPEWHQRDHAAEGGAGLLWTAGPVSLSLRAAFGYERLDVEGQAGHDRGALALAAAGEAELAGGRLRLSPSVRWDRQGPFEGLSARLGAVLALGEVLSLRASGGRSFRPPDFAELYLQQGLLQPNPDLVPETGWSGDAGLVAQGRLGLASVGAFARVDEELVVYEAVAVSRMKPFNDGKAGAAGLEAELASAPLGPLGLAASAAYTFLATETLRGDPAEVGRELPHRARHRLFARLGIDPGPAEAHAELHYVSSQYVDLRNIQPVPAALTLHVGAALRLLRRPAVSLNLEVRNLLDDRSLQDGFGNPLPGRMALVTLRAAGKESRTP